MTVEPVLAASYGGIDILGPPVDLAALRSAGGLAVSQQRASEALLVLEDGKFLEPFEWTIAKEDADRVELLGHMPPDDLRGETPFTYGELIAAVGEREAVGRGKCRILVDAGAWPQIELP